MSGNLFNALPSHGPDHGEEEEFITLAALPGARVERIVSTGQCSPPDFWYDQDWDEFVLLVSGAAVLEIEGEGEARLLGAGDWLSIPAGTRHRVAWTAADQPTVWLAVHGTPAHATPAAEVPLTVSARSPWPP